MVLFFSKSLFKNLYPKFDLKIAKLFLKFSTPLLVSNLIGWLFVSYEQFIYEFNFGLVELAVFNFGIQICLMYKYPFEGLLRAFNVYLFEKMKNIENGIKSIFVFLISILTVGALPIILFTDEIIQLLGTEEYLESVKVVHFMILPKFILLVNYVLVLMLLIMKRSDKILKSTVISLVVLLILGTILIPKYGFIGAAISATLTFSSRTIYLSNAIKNNFELVSIEALILLLFFVIIVTLNAFTIVNYMWIIILSLLYVSISTYFNQSILKRLLKI